ncbi:MAG: IPT/TIG domain-containing protein [Thermoplasmata archaeon]
MFVTTRTGSNTLATTFPLGCLLGPTPGTVSPTFRVNQSLVGPPQSPPPPPPAPDVTSVSPTEGWDGELVTVTGDYFGPGALVYFGAFESQAVTVVSDTQLLRPVTKWVDS